MQTQEQSVKLNQAAAVLGRVTPDPSHILEVGFSFFAFKVKHLIRLAYEALPENGALVAIENLIDDDRQQNAFGLMISLNMLIEFGNAFDFIEADFWQWCEKAGFRRYEVLHLAGPYSAAIACK